MPDERSKRSFVFLGNQLCLDFLNTQPIRGGVPTDLLRGFGDLVAWLKEAQVISPAQADEIRRRWEKGPEAKEAFVHGLEFRGILRQMAESLMRGKGPSRAAVASINELLRYRVRFNELILTTDGVERRSRLNLLEPAHLLCPVAESASDLLCLSDPSLVKQCESKECVIFFYDATKNHSRRWCDMATCGNREKAAAHYRRLKTKGSAGKR